MAAHESPADVVRHRPVWLKSAPPEPSTTTVARGHGDGLARLEVEGLVAVHPTSGRGVESADLSLAAGSFTVVTGAVGAGKTTLIRAVLGLLPRQAGTIRWNGQPIDDPGQFLVPPRAAYAGQVPRLFSAPMRENLLLGWPDDGALESAIHLGALDRDLEAMPDQLDTIVGPRGVRLSGGQVQRATAARALVRSPELLVVDDLSSALDVETEELLWARLAEAGGAGTGPATLLVVSHRAAALRRADQVIVLDRGRVVGAGPLPRLLDECPEMRRLWVEELVIEAEEEMTA
jgi:ATP-binding cassette subfamily B protein